MASTRLEEKVPRVGFVVGLTLPLSSLPQQIPVFLRLDGVSEKLPEVVAQHEARPGLSLRRLLLYQDLYERLMNVHMPYLSLGHHDPAFRTSTETCVESAKMILVS